MDKESVYWLFSSSAQSVSAFIAFLVTGFALVMTMMEAAQSRDETLEEIHDQLKLTYYKRIRVLSIITGLAIVLSLLMVYLNGTSFNLKVLAFIFTSLINAVAIIGGILFVISIINPSRYKRAAEQVIQKEKNKFETTGTNVDQTDFMKEFINLEKQIREILKSKDLYIPYGNTPQMVFSFRQMINALYRSELISKLELTELLEINKFRNLVFHGHIDNVDKGMVDKVKKYKDIKSRVENDR